MAIAITFLFQLFIGGLLLWGAIKIVDRGNSKNTLPAAIGWSLIIALASIAPVVGGIVGLVVFAMVCFRYYDLGVIRTIGVLLVEIGLALGGAFVIGTLTNRHAEVAPPIVQSSPADPETK